MTDAPLPAIRDDTAPELLTRAERALELVSTPDEAEWLWRELSAVEQAARLAKLASDTQVEVAKLRLRAERRWGELLGPAENHGPATVTGGNGSSSDRVAKHRARQVAEVPPPVFERFLERAKDPEHVRRARLLRVAREAAPPPEPDLPPAVTDADIRIGDLRTALDDLLGLVDAIVTDPPYPAEFLDEYDALGELASRLLKPTGLLVVMVGQTHLPEYLRRLGKHLPYRWCGAYLTDGPATRVWGPKVGTKWKPLLIFGGSEFITQDVFSSAGGDKEHHHWGQSESGMADIISRLTLPGQLVVDPFLGGGTTAVVCRDLGRRFIGCDVDASAVATTSRRLAA